MLIMAVGVVLYNPDLNRLRENIDAVLMQCEHIFFVDNSSDNFLEISDTLESYGETLKYTVIKNSVNVGIATALNQMCKEAKMMGYEWILTLDQDSVCPSNLKSSYNKYIEKKKIGMLCPVIVDRNGGIYSKNTTDKIVEVKECITSASLLNLNVWQKIGGFDELMFIDGVDFDICHRIWKAGYRILQVTDIKLLHEIGHISVHRFLFWKVIIKNHSAFRKYYIARNTIYLAKKEKDRSKIVKSWFQSIKLMILTLLYEDNCVKKEIAIFKGILDGIRLPCE